jgi:hypothetical protein
MIRAQLVIWKRKIAPVMLADEGCNYKPNNLQRGKRANIDRCWGRPYYVPRSAATPRSLSPSCYVYYSYGD